MWLLAVRQSGNAGVVQAARLLSSIGNGTWDVASIHNPDNPDASSLVGTRGGARGLTPARLALESGVFHKKWLLGAVCIEWLDRLSKPIQSLSK